MASTSVIGRLGSKTTDPEDRARLVTRKVAPTGLAEYAFGSSSWADTGAHVTSTRPTSPMTRAAMLDMAPNPSAGTGLLGPYRGPAFGRKGDLVRIDLVRS